MNRFALLLAAFLLAGCAAAPAQPAPAGTGQRVFNDTDVMFSQMMVAHHAQAQEMLRLAREKAVREDLRTLVAAIEVTEADEGKTMRVWLETWQQPPAADPSAHAGHGGAHGTSPDDIKTLATATGGDFDTRFLNMFIAHQHNAVEIARMETGTGVNPGALDLAKRIEQSRSAEIQQMLRYLNPPA